MGKRLDEAVYRRVDQVLDQEDRVVILIDRHHVSCYVDGFAASPCQLELMEHELGAFLARWLRPLLSDGSSMSAPEMKPSRS